MVGVEWEYNRADTVAPINSWASKWNSKIIHDGSCGMEVVTAPMAGDFIEKALTELGSSFKKAGATANAQCGIHVHVDAHDVAWSDMYRLLATYAHIEPLLYLLAGQERMTNQYCKSCGPEYREALNHETDRKNAVLSIALGYGLANSGKQNMRNGCDKKGGGRYRGLNIMPWLAGRKFRAPDTTVEFRIHGNSLDSKQVVGWTKVCARLVDWVTKSSDSDFSKLPKSALRALCEVIAPDCKEWILNRINTWRSTTSIPKRKKSRKTPRLIKFKCGSCAV
jgi:hypothetical protein